MAAQLGRGQEIPSGRRRLLDLPLVGHLATIRPDGTVQVTPMWYKFDGEHVRFTHTIGRQKYRNLQKNPSMALSIVDPDDNARYIEVAGILLEVSPDEGGAFWMHLKSHYGEPVATPPPDAASRVVLVMAIARATWL